MEAMDAKLDERAVLKLLRQALEDYLQQMRHTIRLTGQIREEKLTPQQRDDLSRLFRDWKKD